MPDGMKTEFLAAYRAEFGFGEMTATANDDAAAMLKAAAWAWQASREAAVIELPEMLNDAQIDEVEVAEVLLAGQGLSNLAGSIGCAYLVCKELPILRAAIEAQGLKVKP